MESEKVKAWLYERKDGKLLDNSYNLVGISYGDILTYINELEAENERLSKELTDEWQDRRKAEEDLHKAQWNYKIGLSQSQANNKKHKNRIAELEKENENKTETIADLLKKQEFYESKKLKQFAERLKEDFTKKKNRLTKAKNIKNKVFLFDALTLKIVELEYAINVVDETLKEFINE